ncbi:MAG: Uncharacterised protein [Synechococcus sp. CC9902]|nr:MAG: Uncharacterised protein [Synechococcus sp. CC9902]
MSLGGDDHQGRHRADHQGVDEGAQHGHRALANRVISASSGVGDRGAAKARFVGEDSSLETHQNHLTQGTADSGFAGKGIREDGCEGLGNGGDVQQQHQQTTTDVEH